MKGERIYYSNVALEQERIRDKLQEQRLDNMRDIPEYKEVKITEWTK